MSLEATDKTHQAEGEFLTALLHAIAKVDEFYQKQEAEYAQRIAELACVLHAPKTWILQRPIFEDAAGAAEAPDFARVVAALEGGVHVPAAQAEALEAFLGLCSEVDLLRKFSVLNSLAVSKIIKKHDKHSVLKLTQPVLNVMASQGFHMSRGAGSLAATFTHAQCVASEIIKVAARSRPDTADYTCSICLDLLNMPVVLSCAHRFCYGCLGAASAFHTHNCPLCKKETDLDPDNYEVDPVLNRFVTSHFRRPDGHPTSSEAASAASSGAPSPSVSAAASTTSDAADAATGGSSSAVPPPRPIPSPVRGRRRWPPTPTPPRPTRSDSGRRGRHARAARRRRRRMATSAREPVGPHVAAHAAARAHPLA